MNFKKLIEKTLENNEVDFYPLTKKELESEVQTHKINYYNNCELVIKAKLENLEKEKCYCFRREEEQWSFYSAL